MTSLPSLSLRVKLTVLYVGLLALLLTAFGVVLYLDTRQFLINQTATSVRAQAKPVVDHWLIGAREGAGSLNLDESAQALSWDLTSTDTVAVVLGSSGEELAKGKRLPVEPDPAVPNPQEISRALDGQNGVTYIESVNGMRHLVALVPIRPEPGDPRVVGVIQLNTPLTEVDILLRQQRLMIGGGVLICLALGTAGGLWLTTSALAPLRRMILTCRRIAAGDLRQRLDLSQHHEIGQLASAFDEMVDRIEASFTSQRRFIADAAHELRTPLTALRGSLEVLLRNSPEDPHTVRRLHQGMYSEVTRLSRLAEQLLDEARLRSPMALRPHPVSMPAFFSEFLPHARMLAPDQHIELIGGETATIRADADALKQAMYNLVDNAAQHTPAGGRIEIGWRQQNGTVKIWVADDGDGIARDDLPYVFEPFYRGDRSRSRDRGGAGLGLVLTKTIVDGHGGKLTVATRPGMGTRFVISLPITDDINGRG